MHTISITARYDGNQIVLDEPFELEKNAELLITVLPKRDDERESWSQFSLQQLERAYGEDEPEYTIDLIKRT